MTDGDDLWMTPPEIIDRVCAMLGADPGTACGMAAGVQRGGTPTQWRSLFVNPPYDERRPSPTLDLTITRPTTLTRTTICRNCTIESHGQLDLNGFALIVRGRFAMLTWAETRVARRRRRRARARGIREMRRRCRR